MSPAAVQATYELTALICQITDEAESEQAAAAAAAAKRGAGGLPGAIGTMSPGGAGSRTPGGSSSSSPGGVYQVRWQLCRNYMLRFADDWNFLCRSAA